MARGGSPNSIRLSPSVIASEYNTTWSPVKRQIYLFSIICEFRQMTTGDFLAKNKGYLAKATCLSLFGLCGPGIKNIGQ
jgi:hypothetical protein